MLFIQVLNKIRVMDLIYIVWVYNISNGKLYADFENIAVYLNKVAQNASKNMSCIGVSKNKKHFLSTLITAIWTEDIC